MNATCPECGKMASKTYKLGSKFRCVGCGAMLSIAETGCVVVVSAPAKVMEEVGAAAGSADAKDALDRLAAQQAPNLPCFAKFRCPRCGELYRVGVDANLCAMDRAMGQMLPIMGILFEKKRQEGKEEAPDAVSHVVCSRISNDGLDEMRQHVLAAYNGVKTGVRRYWRCDKCGVVREYTRDNAQFAAKRIAAVPAEKDAATKATCPNCSKRLTIKAEWKDKLAKCPKCQARLRINRLWTAEGDSLIFEQVASGPEAPAGTDPSKSSAEGRPARAPAKAPQKTDTGASRMSGICDLCNERRNGEVVPAGRMGQAARKGYCPTGAGEMLKMAGLGPEAWQQDAIDGRTSQSDWLVCNKCMESLRAYL